MKISFKSRFPEEALIYLVGTKLDLVKDDDDILRNELIRCRKKAKLLIESYIINKDLEVSAKNNKGIDNLMKNIKWYILRDKECHNCNFKSNRIYLLNIFRSNKNYCKILDKYMNM